MPQSRDRTVIKNLFAVNKTASREATDFDSNPYLAAHVSEEVRDLLKNAFSGITAEDKPAEPTPEETAFKAKLNRCWLICLLSLIAAVAMMAIGSRLGWFEQMPLLHILDMGLLIVAVVFNVKARRLSRKVGEISRAGMNADFSEVTARLNEAAERAAAELGVPSSAVSLEILPFHYKLVKGEAAFAGRRNRFDNIATSAFVRDNALCLATAQELFCIPLADIRGYRTYDEEFEIDYWLKSEDCEGDTYKAYNIRRAGFMSKKCRTYYGIAIEGAHGAYEFFVPCYDLSVLTELVDVQPLA